MPIKSSTHSVFNTFGASNHAEEERSKNDFYATPQLAVRKSLQLEQFDENIWEPACGMNHITNVLRQHGYKVRTSDIVNMTGEPDIELLDIFTYNGTFDGDIISNPPYSLGKEFTEKRLEIVPEGHKVAMFLKLQFLESKKRYDLFKKYPPKVIYVSINRLGCSKTGQFNEDDNCSSTICYCWYIWEKGYTGDTIIKWF